MLTKTRRLGTRPHIRIEIFKIFIKLTIFGFTRIIHNALPELIDTIIKIILIKSWNLFQKHFTLSTCQFHYLSKLLNIILKFFNFVTFSYLILSNWILCFILIFKKLFNCIWWIKIALFIQIISVTELSYFKRTQILILTLLLLKQS